jgi:hypothetical protein
MNGRSQHKCGKPKTHTVLFSFRAAIADSSLHHQWLPADGLHEYIQAKFQLGNEVKFTENSIMRIINQSLSKKVMVPNKVDLDGIGGVDLLCYYFQEVHEKGKLPQQDFFCVMWKEGLPTFSD